ISAYLCYARTLHDALPIFANVRFKNQLAPGTEGGYTTYFPEDEVTTIYDAAMRYKERGTPLIGLAGDHYGSGSSRDWAAKGTIRSEEHTSELQSRFDLVCR